jgi:hypothetical protein
MVIVRLDRTIQYPVRLRFHLVRLRLLDTRLRGYDELCGHDELCGFDEQCGHHERDNRKLK